MSKNKIALSLILLIGLFGGLYFYSQSSEVDSDLSFNAEDIANEDSTLVNNGLADHQIYYSTSSDGVNWTRSSEAIAKYASVPNLLKLDKAIGDFEAGTLITHFVDASEMTTFGEEFIGYLWSDDNGETWSNRERIYIEGIENDIVTVDPSVVQLDDGRLRIYYYDFISYDAGGENGTPSFYSAVSEDGINFEFEQKVFDFDGTGIITDPELIWFKDRWLLYFPINAGEGGQIMHVAESMDGLNFTSIADIEFSGIPGALVVDGQVELFGCGKNISRVVSDDGINFNTDHIEYLSGVGGCDPDPVQLDDGSFGLMTKEISMNDTLESSSVEPSSPVNAFISIHLEPNDSEEISEIEKYLEELILMSI